MIQRREFLIALGAGVVSVGLAPKLTAVAQDAGASSSPPVLTKDQFAPLVNSWFDVGGTLSLQLVQIVDGPVSPSTEQFSLEFCGAEAPALPAGLYDVSQDTLGPLQLYLEPIGADAQGAWYRADFNLLLG